MLFIASGMNTLVTVLSQKFGYPCHKNKIRTMENADRKYYSALNSWFSVSTVKCTNKWEPRVLPLVYGNFTNIHSSKLIKYRFHHFTSPACANGSGERGL